MVLRPGAKGAQASWPKYEWVAPVATTSQSYPTSPSERMTRFFSGSTAVASAKSTVVFVWRRRIRRMGEAISAGDRPAVATW